MNKLKQRLLFVHKGIEQTPFPHLMNADKVRGDNQTGIKKGISLTDGFTLICQVVPSPPWLVGSAHQRMTTKKWPSSEHLLPHIPPSPTSPCLLHAPHPSPLPSTGSPLALYHPSPLSLARSQLPHGLLWPILHLPKPTTDAWCVKKVRSSGLAEAPFLPLHRGGLPCGFIIICRWHSAQVQAQCKRWHQRGGMRLATHLVISCP